MGADEEMGDSQPAGEASVIEAETQGRKTVLLYRNAGVALSVTIAITDLLCDGGMAQTQRAEDAGQHREAGRQAQRDDRPAPIVSIG